MGTRRYLLVSLLIVVSRILSLASDFDQECHSSDLRSAGERSARSSKDFEDLRLIVKHVDISHFPEVSIIFDARDKRNEFVPGLTKRDFVFYRDGLRREILSLEKISSRNSVPVDFVFVLDQTGSMKREIEVVKKNITNFVKGVAWRGIDYQLGLITFSDSIESRHDLTDNLLTFGDWIERLSVAGGADERENVLEALRAATTLHFRKTASKIFVLITDALYHQKGEQGDGTTSLTTQTVIPVLLDHKARVYCVVPSQYSEFQEIVKRTDAKVFDIYADFRSILSDCGNEITNLYALRFVMPPDSLPQTTRVAIEKAGGDKTYVDQELSLFDGEKKIVIDNVLFDFDKAFIKPEYVEILDRIVKLLNLYPLNIVIKGHTDDTGSETYNQALSEARANSVREYLQRAGYKGERMVVKGYGKSHPIASNDTEEGRLRNRRVEIVLQK
jgi:outer membrane protein OmpA-like peptidoglycan-associated protein/Mg-chelatase subunit ChlD